MHLLCNFNEAEHNLHSKSISLHGDWAVGYYVNFYYISSHVQYPGFENTPEVRIWSSLGGTFKPDRGNCKYRNIEKCSEKAHVCHRQNALSMANQTKNIAAKNPGAIVHSGTPQRKNVRTAKSLVTGSVYCTLSHNSCDKFQRSALNMHDN